MNLNKLIILIAAIILPLSSYAEYYVVCTPPTIQYVYPASRPSCRIVHHGKHYKYHSKPHYKYHRPVYRNRAEISVYYIWNTFPSVCSCTSSCFSCMPCSSCYNSMSNIYYAPASQAYIPDEYNYDGSFDFDRRTADDIGNDMDIDY